MGAIRETEVTHPIHEVSKLQEIGRMGGDILVALEVFGIDRNQSPTYFFDKLLQY